MASEAEAVAYPASAEEAHEEPLEYPDAPGEGFWAPPSLWADAPAFLGGMAPLLVLGAASLVLAAFLEQIWVTVDPAGDGLLKTAGWFGWVGQAALGVGLLVAGLRPSNAQPALRLGILALALLVLLGLDGTGLLAPLLG